MADKERRAGYLDIASEIQLLRSEVKANTTAVDEWRGALRIGRWFVSILIAIGTLLIAIWAVLR